MRFLIVHIASANLHPDFRQAQLYQRRLFAQQMNGVEQFLLTDVPCPNWPSKDQRSIPFFTEDGLHLASKIRNEAIHVAIRRGVDWLLLLDADYVVLQRPLIFPRSGFGQPTAFWDRPDCLIAQPLKAQQALLRCSTRPWTGINYVESPRPSSSFILHSDVFSSARYDEGFVGHGSQDNHFFKSLRASGIQPTYNDCVLLHRYHPPREMDPCVYQRNKKRLNKSFPRRDR